MRLLILNGPNLNMLGTRNKSLYGNKNYKDLIKELKTYSKNKKIRVKSYQSNCEGKIISYIQKNYKKFDGMIVNLGAYTHYSYAIRDALELTDKNIVEVHITDINNREEFRKKSVIENLAKERIIGKGTDGYKEAIDWFIKK